MSLSVCLSVCLFVSLSVCYSVVDLSVYLSVFTCLFVCQTVCLLAYVDINLLNMKRVASWCILFYFLRAVSDIVFWGVGKESVAAASFLQTNLLCLVHGKVLSGGQVEL